MPGESLRPEVAEAVLHWYAAAGRPLPWRTSLDPYSVWLSEIMLQQTSVKAVLPYYRRFRAAFPDVSALAAAPLDDVLREWAGLGYYARARNLQAAAQRIAANGGRFPADRAAWRALPGIGEYTAAALASIVNGEDVIALDGNLMRVGARITADDGDIEAPSTRNRIAGALRAILPHGHAGDFNQAMMDLGATVCLPRAPRCDVCPIRDFCRALATGAPVAFPVRSAKPARARRDFVVAVVRNDAGRVLVARQPDRGIWGGLWVLPFAEGRRWAAALPALEEMAATPLDRGSARSLARVEHGFTHFIGRYTAYAAMSARAPRGHRVRWVDPRVPGVGVPVPHARIMRALPR